MGENECWRRRAKKGEFSSGKLGNARMVAVQQNEGEIVRRSSGKRGKIGKIGLAEVRDITECTRKKIEDEIL